MPFSAHQSALLPPDHKPKSNLIYLKSKLKFELEVGNTDKGWSFRVLTPVGERKWSEVKWSNPFLLRFQLSGVYAWLWLHAAHTAGWWERIGRGELCALPSGFHRLYVVDGVDGLYHDIHESSIISCSSVNGGKFNRLRNWNRQSLCSKSEEESPPDQFQYSLGQNRIFFSYIL